jgi:filamentous hemagglutinin family protein
MRLLALLPLLASCFATGAAYAQAVLPTNPHAMTGIAGINTVGNTMTVTTNAARSIVNWQTFSIGSGATVAIQQPGATSANLNRVVGSGGAIDPSLILGTLQSNGRVFLLNPSGIVFGAGSQVDVAGLVASSLNLSNADFLSGRLNFTAVPGAGAVLNQGAINAASGGEVYLVGPAVTHSGIITSPQGEVILAAGNSVDLVNPGTPNLRVEITAPDNEAKNLGTIVAQSGRIGIYAGLITSSGTLNADRAVVGPAGEILLKATASVAVEGIISALDGTVTIEGPFGIPAPGPGPVVLVTPPVLNTSNVIVATGGGSTSGSLCLGCGASAELSTSSLAVGGAVPAFLSPITATGQVIQQGTAQIVGTVSMTAQINNFATVLGTAGSQVLAPPRASLVFEPR